jgi:hypothetical protein
MPLVYLVEITGNPRAADFFVKKIDIIRILTTAGNAEQVNTGRRRRLSLTEKPAGFVKNRAIS